VQELTGTLKVSTGDVASRVAAMQKDSFAKDKEIAALKSEVALAKSMALVSKVCLKRRPQAHYHGRVCRMQHPTKEAFAALPPAKMHVYPYCSRPDMHSMDDNTVHVMPW
jgi:hypothetical protein